MNDKQLKSVTIKLDLENYEILRKSSELEDLSIPEFIRYAIKRAVKEQKNGNSVGTIPL